MKTITVKSKEVKKEGTGRNGLPYTIWTIVDQDGVAYDTFDDLEIGKEYQGEVKENAPYDPHFRIKGKRGGGKYGIDARVGANHAACILLAAGLIQEDQFIERRKKFFEYIMNGE